ncbi:MAG TPA: LysE family translocator [Alphaproteobacteria bacterium]|nr:LysE family translocator [Alphaproteobacteria bacterium]
MLFDPQTLSIFILAVVVLMVTPGPDMLFIAANGIAQGPRAGTVSALGVGVGCLVHTLLAAAGISALVLATPVAFDVIRFAGAAYLAWLGVQAIRNPAMLDLHVSAARARTLGAVFRGGVLCNVLNPKVAVFFIAFLPQFADPSRGPIAIQMVVLGVVLTVIGTTFNMLIGLSGGGIGRFLSTRPRFARVQAWVSGLIFIGLAARLALTGRSH